MSASEWEKCEKGTCDCFSGGRRAYLSYVFECATQGCTERSLGFVSTAQAASCRRCGQPAERKHSAGYQPERGPR